MWGTNQNRMNNSQDTNVNTILRTSSSDTSSLTISLWNQNISLKIRPAVGVDGNGITQYDKGRSGNTALTQEAAASLFEEFKNVILPVYNKVVLEGEPCPENLGIFVETGRDAKRNLVGIEMRPSKDERDTTPDMYFVLYGMVDENGTAVEANTFRHKFQKRLVKVGYNPMNGVSQREIRSNSDFNLFLNIIGKTELLLPYSEHVAKYNKERFKGTSSNSGSFGQSGGFPSGSLPQSSGTNFSSNGPSSYGGFGGASNFGLDSGEIPFN